MKIKRVTPIIFVEEIEPCLLFWTDLLGFSQAAAVPEGDRLGFVILKLGDVEVMYQSRASIAGDVPELADTPMEGSILFIEVEDIDELERALLGVEKVIPRRKTFYGADELTVREPAGNLVTFAQFAE